MNTTRWEELRRAMDALGESSPRWRTRDLSGYLSPWDGEWYYHFRDGGYEPIEWVEVQITSPTPEALVLAALQAVHVPGERTERGFRVVGYWTGAGRLNYL